LIWSLPQSFSLQEEMIFHGNICVIVCNCYFRLLIFVIILFGALTSSSNQRLCATSHQALTMDKTHPHNRLQLTYMYTCPSSQDSNGHAHVLCIVLLSNLPNHIPFLSLSLYCEPMAWTMASICC